MAYSTINKSSSYFNTLLYTGNGSTNALTGVGFKPDFTWIKSRSVSRNHKLFDIVRGVTKVIGSNEADAESTVATSLTAFGSDGFTVSSDVSVNENSATLAAWNWLAGGSQGSSNTDGSINTAYTSANTTSGFSISKYTGTGANATVGHGLGAVPKMILTKNLDQGSEGWLVYHASLGNTKTINLNSNGTTGTNTSFWNDTTPTSSVFSVGTNHGSNGPSHNMIAYCFAEKTGYSKIGSYTGNGDADGPFVYCGFKPTFILTKQSSASGEGWQMHDSKRIGYNPDNNQFYANTDGTEATGDYLNIFSNGFKITNTNSVINGNNATYIYMAIGQSIVGSNNVPCNAR
jgi:hypothetical protein